MEINGLRKFLTYQQVFPVWLLFSFGDRFSQDLRHHKWAYFGTFQYFPRGWLLAWAYIDRHHIHHELEFLLESLFLQLTSFSLWNFSVGPVLVLVAVTSLNKKVHGTNWPWNDTLLKWSRPKIRKNDGMATYGKATQNQHSSHVWFPFVFSNWLFCPSIIYRSNLLLNPNKASQISLKYETLIGWKSWNSWKFSKFWNYSLLDSIYWGRTLAVFLGSFTPVFGHLISFQLTGSKRKPYLFVASITPEKLNIWIFSSIIKGGRDETSTQT